ncbi:MAG TPA: hypothetical protein VF651_01825 [Gammaproteobacteria bacterium]
MSKSFIGLLAASLVVGVLVALLSGVAPTSAAGIGYVLGAALMPVLIAFVLVGIPAGIYWLVKRKPMPGLTLAIWAVWGLVNLMSILGHFMGR